MATDISQITVSATAVITVVVVIITCLGGYIWDKHIKELSEAKKLLSETAKASEVEALKQNLERRLEAGDARFRTIEQNQQLKIDAIREEFREESSEMRKEMNGLGERLTRQGEAMEERLARQIEIMGQGFEKQMAMIISHSEQQNRIMIELQKVLAAAQATQVAKS